MYKLSQFAVIEWFVGFVVDSLGDHTLLPVSTSLGSEINALTLLKQTPQEPQTRPSSHDLDHCSYSTSFDAGGTRLGSS